jgi:hypothetical protein
VGGGGGREVPLRGQVGLDDIARTRANSESHFIVCLPPEEATVLQRLLHGQSGVVAGREGGRKGGREGRREGGREGGIVRRGDTGIPRA